MFNIDREYLKYAIELCLEITDKETWIELFESDKSGVSSIMKMIEVMESNNEITSKYDDFIKLKDSIDSIVRYVKMSNIFGFSLIISTIISMFIFYEKYDNCIFGVLSSIIHRYKLFDEKIICIKKNIIEESYKYDKSVDLEKLESYLNYMVKCQLFEYSDTEEIIKTEDTILPVILSLVKVK